jgi:hypothetical protein
MMVVRVRTTGGPLTRRVHREVDAKDIEGLRELMASLSQRAMAPDAYIGALAKRCAAFLEAQGIVSVDPQALPEAVEAAGFEHPSPEWYAAQIVHLASMIKGCVHANNPWAAVRLAFQLGRYSVQGGLTHRDNQEKEFEAQRENRARTNKQAADQWRAPVLQAAREIWAERSDLSASDVARHIHRRRIGLDKSHRTLRGVISRVRPR